uniref:putative gustatory receptor clone PTE01 n=1 Tax=Gasterosteus aculeatus aculeatus TaxID=481459 RepID=UPI001A998898|nr:putative gustatory receptor clone PTE01 [Gasterosteus aculeatus aculeatus]
MTHFVARIVLIKKMENSTEVVSFLLSAYGNIGNLKYLYFCIMLLWYISICATNTILIVVIYMDRRLHEPMYLLLCHLFMNEISASTSLYPLLLSQMFSDTHEVTLPWCFLQMCCFYIFSCVELCSLTAMAYDRYVCICYPLQYNVVMSTERVGKIILLVWIYSFTSYMFSFSFVIPLKFCGNVIDKVFCDQQLVIKLACSVSALTSISDLFFGFMCVILPFSFISVSYMKILWVCLFVSKKSQQKVLTTCTPQIVSLSIIFVGATFHFVGSRLDIHYLPAKVRIILSIYIHILQPMITPFMYGLYLSKIRQSCKRLLFD